MVMQPFNLASFSELLGLLFQLERETAIIVKLQAGFFFSGAGGTFY